MVWEYLKEPRKRGGLLLAMGLIIATAAGVGFRRMHQPEPIVAGPGVTTERMLSHYVSSLAGTPADTPVFILEGKQPGATMLILGGVHPQEVAGLMAAVLMVENAEVQQGRLIVIPQSNRSGFTYTEPLEGFPHEFTIDTPHGPRWFRVGMRLTNPVHQWPDPDLYIHPQTGEPMVGWEARNLNRAFPGDANGRYTHRLNAAIIELIREENVDMVFDMHEAYPEYPVINMLVAHENAFEVATIATWGLEARGIAMDLQPSPKLLRGLSHREVGDHTTALAVLGETANAAMGRFRGRTSSELVVGGRDRNYERAAGLGRLFVPFTEEGHPLISRAARHLATIEELINGFNEINPERQIIVSNVPEYEQLLQEGFGPFLRAVPQG